MKLRFLLLGTIIVTLSMLLTSCQNSTSNKREVIGKLKKDSSPTVVDFSKFSGTESYVFTISEETNLTVSLKLHLGKILISVVDSDGNEHFSTNTPVSNEVIKLNPSKETTYYIDLKYDNAKGTYSFKLE